MARLLLSKSDRQSIERAVAHFAANRRLFEAFAKGLIAQFENHDALARHIHFMKYRIKDPSHLRGKLERKLIAAKRNNTPKVIDEKNVFEECR
jgi:ppGpp synthetase/RelA/SpoT-type nucleotidyltranferase